jgi:hypothetical protein
MDADDASSAEMKRLFADPDPLALDEETAERLLNGDLTPAQAPPGYAEVAELLAAAVAAPNPEELSGQAAALAELRAVTRARRSGATTWRAGRPRRRRRVGLAAVVVAGALATGGAAAAATGHLPGPVRDAARSILVTVGGAEPATPTLPGRRPAPITRTPGSGSNRPSDQGTPLAGSTDRRPGSTRPGSVARPDTERLCQAFTADKGSEQGKKLDAAAFEALAQAAGGADKITAFCQNMQPGKTKPKKPQQEPPDDQGQGQGGPPPSTGGGSQGQDSPPGTPPPSR